MKKIVITIDVDDDVNVTVNTDSQQHAEQVSVRRERTTGPAIGNMNVAELMDVAKEADPEIARMFRDIKRIAPQSHVSLARIFAGRTINSHAMLAREFFNGDARYQVSAAVDAVRFAVNRYLNRITARQ